MAGVTVVTLIAKAQNLAFFLPVKRERDAVFRQQRGLEFDVLNRVKTPARREQGKRVEMCYERTGEQVAALGAKKGVRRVVYVDARGVHEAPVRE